jgi:hypothetical protein
VGKYVQAMESSGHARNELGFLNVQYSLNMSYSLGHNVRIISIF